MSGLGKYLITGMKVNAKAIIAIWLLYICAINGNNLGLVNICLKNTQSETSLINKCKTSTSLFTYVNLEMLHIRTMVYCFIRYDTDFKEID